MLGAALAPTDATAVGVLARDLPRRTVTVLRAESLVNDGTALVLYGLAVGVTVGEEHLTGWHVTWLLVLAYGGGVLAGALIGLVSWQVRRRMDDPMLETIAMLVTPFAAFLLADVVHASGVLAVVVLRAVHEPGDAADHRCRRDPADRRPVLGAVHHGAQQCALRAGRPRRSPRVRDLTSTSAVARARRHPRGHRRRDRGAVGRGSTPRRT